VQRSANRITRDNSGKITSVGGQGATARGGRLKTASGNQRAAQTAKVSGGKAKGTISKKRQGMSDSDKQSMQMAKALRSGKSNPAVDAVRRRQENSAASRRQANSLAKGNLLKTTEADRRNRAQSLAAAQRKLSEMEKTGSGRNSLTGSNTALLGQRAQVAALSKPLPEFRKPNRSDVVAKNRDALARRGSERRNAQTMADFRAKTAKPTAAATTKPVARTSKAPANAATVKPAAAKRSQRKAVGAISEAKAGRIIARIDANRPGLRPASGSNRKTANAIKTHNKASNFGLAAAARARKQGKNLSVNESLQRGVKNASKAAAAKRKPKR
jgi:hypothetical protein